MLEKIDSLDKALFHQINGVYYSEFLDPVMLLISDTKFWILIFLVPVIVSAAVRHLRAVLIPWIIGCILTFALADSISFRIIKASTQRFRPCYQLEDTRLVPNSCGGNYSFPSNHAANSMGIAVVSLYFLGLKVGGIVMLIALLVGYSRIYLGVHFPLDIFVGFLLGAFCSFCCLIAMKKFSKLFMQHKLKALLGSLK